MIKDFFMPFVEIIKNYPEKFIVCVILAFVPTLAWLIIFEKHNPRKTPRILITFIVGMFSAVILLFYRHLWGDNVDLVFFSFKAQNFEENINGIFTNQIVSAFFVFMSVGFLEEFLKHWVVKKTDHKIFESIDDVIELSIFAALGFAFLENVRYFFDAAQNFGGQKLMSIFLVRSVFVTFIHILCSGIYGYFYGLAYFADPLLHRDHHKKWRDKIPDFFHKFFHFKTETVFKDEMITLGLLIAVFLHGIFDFLMHIDFSLGNFLGREIRLFFVILPVFLVFGFAFLSHLLTKKEDQLHFGKKMIVTKFSHSS